MAYIHALYIYIYIVSRIFTMNFPDLKEPKNNPKNILLH